LTCAIIFLPYMEMKIDAIITHPGSAHKDELLACALLLVEHPVAIYRRDASAEDLNNPHICVIDTGGRHDPSHNNYDHHQFHPKSKPSCSVSLIFEALGLYEDALKFLDWVEPVEWFDCRGPGHTAEWLGVDRRALSRLNSPLDGAVLRAFSKSSELLPGNFLWETLRMIGEDILGFVRGLRRQLCYLAEHTEVWEIEQDGNVFKILFLPRGENLPEEPTLGIGRFIEEHSNGREIIATVYPDRRSGGYGLARYRDNYQVDFRRLEDAHDVHFTHASGFLAKTTAVDPCRLRELLQAAWVGRAGAAAFYKNTSAKNSHVS
jgi:hypothetical protein